MKVLKPNHRVYRIIIFLVRWDVPVNKLHVVLIIFASFLLVGCSVLSDVLGPIVSGMEDEGGPGAYII